mgnify:CR=1 FL=1|jgi:Transposase and inactivated derivatives
MPIVRPDGVEVLVHLVWPVSAPETVALTEEAIERCVPYVTRYAETFNVRVLAVGGVADHLHLLVDLAPALSLEKTVRDLMVPSERFLRDVLGFGGFAWDVHGWRATGVSPADRERVAAYVTEQAARHASGDLDPLLEGLKQTDGEGEKGGDDLPDWLRGVLNREDE